MIEGDDMKKYKFILILLGIMLLAVFNFNFGNDYFWHVKTGEYIINNLSVPTYDIFSWIGLNNFAWISHEWLSEVVIYGFKAIFGDFGPLFFCLIIWFTYTLNPATKTPCVIDVKIAVRISL